jgi:signal transduction histidine kinase/BarA-like signal transduction histidine kinase
MRLSLTIIFLLLNCFSFGQNSLNTNKVSDSTSYFIDLANFHLKNNNYRSSMEFLKKAISFAEKNQNKDPLADAYLFLGNVYKELNKTSDAIAAFEQSIKLYKESTIKANLGYAYYSLGVCYIEKGQLNKAEIYFEEAEKVYDIIKIPGVRDLVKLQKGIVLFLNKKNDLAAKLFNQIISQPDVQDLYKLKGEALYYLGLIEKEQKRFNLALNYLNRANELSKVNGEWELRAKITKALSDIYEKNLDINNSYKFLKNYLAIQDSIQEIKEKRIGVDDFMSFKEAERLKEIEQLDKENKEQQRANKFSKLISILSIALISILSLLSLSLYKNNILRTKSNQLLQDKNNELQLAKDKAEKASKARAEFLSTVSHELRTPLNAINGITHILLEEKPKVSQLQYLNSLKFSGEYLLNFINDILEINRVESENIQVEHINFNIRQILEELKKSFQEFASKNNNDLDIVLDENIPDFLIGDPTKLSQIFINLINNALKFTKNGKVTFSASLIRKEENKLDIHFDITDTGIGIPKEMQHTIFESFSQGSVEINRKYGGTGLGLAIVKRLVELLGGDIQLKSTERIGTSFYFDLTLEKGTSEIITEPKSYNDSIFTGKHILIVEDNKINQMITKKMLESKGMTCEVIDEGESAIEAIRNTYFDLVLMDVHLPGINGTIATQRIREFNKKTPIIALTAISLNENRSDLLSFGMNNVITKPFNPEEFYKVIAEKLS